MAYTIYDKNGNERLAEIEESLQPNAGRFVEPQLEYNGTWMGECFVTLNIKSPVPIKFAIGDYVMYRGEKFVINYDPSVIKKAAKKSTGDAFCYDNVKFSALSYELSDIRMLDFVIDGNNIHWNGLPRFSVFCPSIEEFADRLQENADRYCAANGIGDEERWLFITPNLGRSTSRAGSAASYASRAYEKAFGHGTHTEDERINQNISIDNMSVWDAMRYIKEKFGLSFVVRGRLVIIGAAWINITSLFKYGKGNGLYEIERVADSDQQIVTKLYAYGSSKNLPDRYYAEVDDSPLPNNLAVDVLMLPGFPTTSLFEWVVNHGATNVNSYTGLATWHGYTAYFSQDAKNPWVMSVNADTLGIREATKYFDGSDNTDEIFPTIEDTGIDIVHHATIIEDNGVFDDGEDVPNFKIWLPELGFDLSSLLGSYSAISIKDGFCGGREFHIESVQQVTIEDGGSELSLWECNCQRVKDDGTKLWYPYSDSVARGGEPGDNEPYQIRQGDKYVFVGIGMPSTYIETSSIKLLEASLEFLSKNDATRYTYLPKVDEIYMARQAQEVKDTDEPAYHDIIKEGDVMYFEDEDLNIRGSIYIDSLNIKEYGNETIPTYDVTLRNDKQVGTMQRMQNQIATLTSSGGGGGAGGAVNIPQVESIIRAYGSDLFLSRKKDDTAAGKIRFINKNGVQFGSEFASGITGFGGKIDGKANAELESLSLRRFLEVPELRYNRISIQVGNRWRAPGGGIILKVDVDTDNPNKGTITLHLEDGEIGKVELYDICMGIYHDGMNLGNNDADDFDDSRGNFKFSGFFTTYFTVTRIVEESDNSVFEYQLRNDANYPAARAHHPCAMMHFVCYGNFFNTERQSSRYSTLTYERYLRNVNTWEFSERNIAAQFGDLSNLWVYGLDMTDYSAYLKNIYMSGHLEQIVDIEDRLSTYSVDFSDYVDVITVDDVGNVIGGLYKIENNVPYDYRIHSAISVRKNNQLLTVCGANETVGPGKYKIYVEPVLCTCTLTNSTIYITSIQNIKDGIPGTPDDVNFDYDAMRDMQSCFVNLTIDCEGTTSIIKQFPVTIKHMSEPFVGADITNEFSGVSWNTQTQAYIGLPITFDFKMWHNNEILNIENTSNVSLACATQNVTLVNGTAPATLAPRTIYYEKSIILVNGKKHARIQLTAMDVDLPSVIDIDVTCTAEYSGVVYERTLRHTINRTTDTNVYQLLTDPAEVCAGYNANQQKVLNTNNITCTIRCDSTDDKHYTVPVAEYAKHGLFITAQKFTMDNQDQEVPGAEEAYSTVSGVTISTDNVRVRFKLYKLVDTTLSTISALLNPSNVIEVLDAEDVPVVLDGLDGENSIQVILDNDSDSVTCTEDGTVIAATLSVVHACLMDGEDAIGSSTLGSTRSTDKQKYGTISSGTLTQGWEIECSNCTAEIANAWTTVDGKPWITINLKTITDDTASISVKCLYTKHGQDAYYTRLFTVSKLYGIDKHEIILSPNSICYKPNDDTYTPTRFTVSIYKTTQEEDRHLMTTLPSHSTAQHGDYRLQYSLDKGVNWSNITGYNSGATIRETSDSGSGNKFSWDSADAIEIRLQQYFVDNGVGEWILLDQECEDIIGDGLDGKGVEYVFITQDSWDGNDNTKPTIRDDSANSGFQVDNYEPYTSDGLKRWKDEPVGVSANVGYKYEFYAQRKKENGVWQAFGAVRLWNKYVESGTSPYVMDLSNDNSLINCDDDGTITGSYETSEVMIFEGGRDAYNDFTVTVTGVNITATLSNRIITVSNMQAVGAQVNVRAVHNTNSSIVLTAVYSINKVFPGDSTVVYSLQPSLNVIHKAGDNGGFIDTQFTISIKKSVGQDVEMITNPQQMGSEGIALWREYDDNSSTINDMTGSMASTFTPANLLTYTLNGTTHVARTITFYIREAGQNPQKTYDRERICVVSDGDQGDAFEYEDFTEEQLEALKGPQGLTGCHERVYQQYVYAPNFYYHNDENDDTITGIRYVDFMCIPDPTEASGYKVYMCLKTHQAAATFSDDMYDEDNHPQWERVGQNFSSAYFNYIVAKNAHFEFGSSNQLVVYDANGNIVTGLTGDIQNAAHPEQSVRFWAGNENPLLAPFRVLQNGEFFADNAHIKGFVEIRGANEGLVVYDSSGNEKVQIVSGTVDEPMNVTGERSPSSGWQSSSQKQYSMRPDKYFDLPSITIPVTVNGVNDDINAGSVISGTVGGFLHVNITGNGNVMKLIGNSYAAPERISYQIELQDSNSNVLWTNIGVHSASGTETLSNLELYFANFIIPRTEDGYKFVVRMAIDTINTNNTDSDTWGGLASGANVIANGYMQYNITTPTGLRIGTNGMFFNLASGKSVFISADQTEIKYGNNRLKIDSTGVYGYNGSAYIPIVKKTRSITANATVQPDDGVLFLNHSSNITLTFNADSSKEVIIINKSSYNASFSLPSDKKMFRCNGNETSSYSITDKDARKFIADSSGNYYELYLSN